MTIKRKIGYLLIIAIFVGMIWTIVALSIPAVAEGTKFLFIDLLGKNLVNGAIGVSNGIMIWGSTGFPQAMTVILGSGVTFLIFGLVISRVIWPRRPTWMGNAPKATAPAPLQSQLNTPDLYVPKQTAPQLTPTPPPQPKPEEQTA